MSIVFGKDATYSGRKRFDARRAGDDVIHGPRVTIEQVFGLSKVGPLKGQRLGDANLWRATTTRYVGMRTAETELGQGTRAEMKALAKAYLEGLPAGARRNPKGDYAHLTRVHTATLNEPVRLKYVALKDEIVRLVHTYPGSTIASLEMHLGPIDPGVLLDEVRMAIAHGQIETRRRLFGGADGLYPPIRRRNPRNNRSDVGEAIRRSLTPDLLQPTCRKRVAAGAHPLTGQCSVASEAYYHVQGGKKAGLKPMSVQHEGSPRWWIRDASGRDIDLTAEQFVTPVPYAKGRGRGFPTPKQGHAEPPPSKRAQIVLDRIAAEAAEARTNPSPSSVVVPGMGRGVILARRPGGMVDVRLASGQIVRKPLALLSPISSSHARSR